MNSPLGSEEKDLFQVIAGWIGNALALFFFLSPAVGIWKLIKEEIEHKVIPYILLIANIMNCLLWFVYGIKKDDYQIYGCNGVGGIINAIYLSIFWYYYVENKIPNYIGFLFATYGFLIGVWALFTYGLTDIDLIGKVAMVFNIIMYAAPGQKLVVIF